MQLLEHLKTKIRCCYAEPLNRIICFQKFGWTWRTFSWIRDQASTGSFSHSASHSNSGTSCINSSICSLTLYSQKDTATKESNHTWFLSSELKRRLRITNSDRYFDRDSIQNTPAYLLPEWSAGVRLNKQPRIEDLHIRTVAKGEKKE